MSNHESSNLAFRIGSAALGFLVGLLLGLLFAVLVLTALQSSPSFPLFVFGGGAIGAVAGLLLPEAAWRVVQGTVHFLFGFVFTLGWQDIKPNRDAPQWLRVLLWLGVAAGFAAYVFV